MDFTARVTTLTQDRILPKVVDTILGDNFVTFRVLSNAQKWDGTQMSRPVKYQKSSLGGSFSGLDTHSTATSETRVMQTFDVRGYEQPVAIPGIEKAVNRTPAQVMSLVRVEIESAQQDMMDDIGDLAYGDGTGNTNKDFLGMGAAIDDGTLVDTYGNLSRTTYPTLKATKTASGGTFTLQLVSTLLTTVSSGSSNRLRPTVLVSNETVRDFYEELMSPVVKANYEAYGMPVVTRTSKGAIRGAEATASMGFSSYIYRATPWVADEKCTSGQLQAWNENYINWYGLNDPDLQAISLGTSEIDGPYAEAPSKNLGFQWTGFMRPINQYGEVAHIYLLGNMVCWNPLRQGMLTGFTTV